MNRTLTEQYIKAYPVCRWAQPAIEGAAQLKHDIGLTTDMIKSVTVRTFREATKIAVRSPHTTEEAQYSLPFPVAAMLVHGKIG